MKPGPSVVECESNETRTHEHTIREQRPPQNDPAVRAYLDPSSLSRPHAAHPTTLFSAPHYRHTTDPRGAQDRKQGEPKARRHACSPCPSVPPCAACPALPALRRTARVPSRATFYTREASWAQGATTRSRRADLAVGEGPGRITEAPRPASSSLFHHHASNLPPREHRVIERNRASCDASRRGVPLCPRSAAPASACTAAERPRERRGHGRGA